MQYIEFQGRRVAYFLNGNEEGRPLVLLHGLCEDSSIWDEFIVDLPEFRVIRVDLSGFGASEILPKHSIDLMAESVKAVLDSLGIVRCVMIGHSMGGYTTLAFAEHWPNMIDGIGMFHSHPFADTEARREGRLKTINFINNYGPALYIKQLIPSLFAQLFVTSNEFLMNSLIHRANQYPKEAITGALEAMIERPDRAHVLAKATCPVLFIIGKQDIVIPWETSLRQTTLPDIADVHILTKVAHMGMHRAKDETVRIVRQFTNYCGASLN